MNAIVRKATPGAQDASRFLPSFTTEGEAREFWANHDSAEYWDQTEDVTETPPAQLGIGPGRAGSRARKRPPEGRMDLVSLRFPTEMIEAVKEIAAQRHLPYQTLMRSWVGERLEQERHESIRRTQQYRASASFRDGDKE